MTCFNACAEFTDVPGVMGGDPHLAHSPPARFSPSTSPIHPSLTPSTPKKKALSIGVWRLLTLIGLLMALPEADSGGVHGPKNISGSKCSWSIILGTFSEMRMVGFWYIGLGEAIGVIDAW